MAKIKAQANQVTPDTTSEGEFGYTSMTKLGGLYTADWRQQLILAGYAWTAHVGALTPSADIIAVRGGGVGTVIDSAQPEFIIGVDSGYTMIPLEAHASIYIHPIDDKGINTIALWGDRTTAPQASMASGTAVTPVNLLDGGPSTFPGRSWKAVSGNLTVAPLMDELLDYVAQQNLHATGSANSNGLKMDYMPTAPSLMRGPCQVILCYGATNASGAFGMGVVKVAVVPNSFFPIT